MGSRAHRVRHQQDAGANRYAAEQFQNAALELVRERSPHSQGLRTDRRRSAHARHRVHRPAGIEFGACGYRIAYRARLQWRRCSVMDGADHASEYEALQFAAANPLDPKHMVLVIAGNSALETVKAVNNHRANAVRRLSRRQRDRRRV